MAATVNLKSNITGVLPFPEVIRSVDTVAWYDYTDLSTITQLGGLVSRWNDKLGSGHDLIQATGAYQPSWSSDGILFDGVNDYMKTATFTWNQPEFIYLVIKRVALGTDIYFFDGNTQNIGLIYNSSNTLPMMAYAGTSSAGSSDIAVGSTVIIRVLFNSASSKFIVDDHTPITGNFGAANMGGLTLAAWGNVPAPLGPQYANIQVKEIILRKVADTAGDEASIYNYLKNKYSL